MSLHDYQAVASRAVIASHAPRHSAIMRGEEPSPTAGRRSRPARTLVELRGVIDWWRVCAANLAQCADDEAQTAFYSGEAIAYNSVIAAIDEALGSGDVQEQLDVFAGRTP